MRAEGGLEAPEGLGGWHAGGFEGGEQSGGGADEHRGGESAGPGLEGDDGGPAFGVGVDGGGQGADADVGRASEEGEQDGLGQELDADPLAENCIVIGVTSASLASLRRRPYRRRSCCRAQLPCHRPQPGRPSLYCAITGLPGRQGEQS
jgi:hypothetical protein